MNQSIFMNLINFSHCTFRKNQHLPLPMLCLLGRKLPSTSGLSLGKEWGEGMALCLRLLGRNGLTLFCPYGLVQFHVPASDIRELGVGGRGRCTVWSLLVTLSFPGLHL